MRHAVLGGCAVGLATGWNVANIGAIPSQLADSYDVSLAVVGSPQRYHRKTTESPCGLLGRNIWELREE